MKSDSTAASSSVVAGNQAARDDKAGPAAARQNQCTSVLSSLVSEKRDRRQRCD